MNLVVLSMLVSVGKSANILAIFPIPVKSHYIFVEPLLQELAARGHQLTVYSSFPQKTPLSNFTEVDCSQGRLVLSNKVNYTGLKEVMSNPFRSVHQIFENSEHDCEWVYKILKPKDIISKQFDLVITEMFSNDCYVHFAFKLGVPLVSVVTMTPLPWTPDRFGLPDDPSYIPSSLMNLQPEEMNLVQRLRNTLFLAYAKITYHFCASPKYHRIAERHFEERLPWVEDVARNSSLLLVNSHSSLGFSRPLPPNVIDISGIHIKAKQPLPLDLQDILAGSPQGVIVLSFGSMIRVSSIPTEKINMILSAFSKLSQTVIMKYEDDLQNVPKNVILRKWLPLRDLLEHDHVVGVVTHGGLASVMEAVYFAKPVLGVPVFADQFLNINCLVRRGAGISFDLDSMTDHEFYTAIDQLVNNYTYRENMKAVSEQFRDRPLTALQSAVYWTEYVLRHRGAPHLRPASTGLPFYQLWLLDVIALLLAAILSAFAMFYCVLKYLISAVNKMQLSKLNSEKKIQ